MDKNLIQTESWLSEYLILEKRITALYKQADCPYLKNMFLKMGPQGDKNMAVNIEQERVSGGSKAIPWAMNLEEIYAKVKEVSDDINTKIVACVTQQTEIRHAVAIAGLSHEEYLYIEQRYFLGMSVKEMEREGCGYNKLANIKKFALEKICKVHNKAIKYTEVKKHEQKNI